MNIKILITLLLVILHCATLTVAENDIKTYVNDYAEIISPQSEAQITQILQSIHTTGVAEIAIVTIQSLEGKEINSYAYNLAEGNIGDTTKNNGLLLLIAVEDRKYRFEVGRGLEGELNDAKVGRIGRQILIPSFKKNEYEKGVIQVAQALQAILIDKKDPFPATTNTEGYSSDKLRPYFYLFFIMIIIISSIFGKQRHTRNNNYLTAAVMAASMFGGRGGGRLGGGGFGGGSFGGGGAGGSW